MPGGTRSVASAPAGNTLRTIRTRGSASLPIESCAGRAFDGRYRQTNVDKLSTTPLEVVEQGSTTWVSGAPLREGRVRHYAELGFSTCGVSRVSLQVTNLVVYNRTRPYARIDGSPALIRKIPTCTAFSYPFSTSRLPEQPVARMRQRHIHRVIFTGDSPFFSSDSDLSTFAATSAKV